jgi:hypothetical protein
MILLTAALRCEARGNWATGEGVRAITEHDERAEQIIHEKERPRKVDEVVTAR